jgi:hypothetical protein
LRFERQLAYAFLTMIKPLFILALTVALVAVAVLNQGCGSLGDVPAGMVWYKPGASQDQTDLDWLICQQQALQTTALQGDPNQPQATAGQYQTVPNQAYSPPVTVQPNVYGLGVNSDQYGRPSTYQLQNGQPLDPIFDQGVRQNAYGPGVGEDQFGRAVYNAPYGNNVAQVNNSVQENDAGGQIALNMVNVLSENQRAKSSMRAKGYPSGEAPLPR